MIGRMHRFLSLFAAVLFVLVTAPRASAQLVAAKDGPIVYGHHHVNATSADEHKKFWADTLGGSVVKIGTNNQEVIRMTNVLIFMRAQAAKGGSKGSTADHIGLSVPNLRQTLDKVKAGGYRIVTATEAPAGLTVKGEIAEVAAGPLSGLGYVLGPDDVKVELMEMKAQTEPIKLHHIHFFGPQQEEMRAWYVKVFGAGPAAAANPTFISANLPGVVLNFSAAPSPVAGTAGRAVDHIGFEVKNLEAFLARLEAQGIKPTVPLRRIDALGLSIAFVVDPWGTNIELTEGLDKVP
jgi:catechol 2,3-dioxygenase-like lactoylglutathione lyase family enzyme